MYLKEDQARRNLCCNTTESIDCAASNCMGWRWGEKSPVRKRVECQDKTAEVEPPRPANVPESWEFIPYDTEEGDPAVWLEPVEESNARRVGYCGMAGPVEHPY